MAKKLVYYGGQGTGYSRENGKYEVKYDAKEEKIIEFNKLSEAIKYYESITDSSKGLWDVSGMPELLEYHTLQDLPESDLVSKSKMKMNHS